MDFSVSTWFRIGLVFLFVLIMFDFWFTYIAVNFYGSFEGNPIVEYMVGMFFVFFIVKVLSFVVSAIILLSLKRGGAENLSFAAVWLFCGMYLFLAFNNIFVFIYL